MRMKGKTILVCTLGASWAVVAEVYGFLAPGALDLYRNHPDNAGLQALRREHALQVPDEIWLCTTDGQKSQESIEYIQRWWRMLGQPGPLRIWQAAGTDQLATRAECDHMRELIMRVVLKASEQTRGHGQLLLSLAGGRKTMSADLQSAGEIFGARAWLHIVGPEPLPEKIKRPEVQDLCAPLAAEIAAAIQPLVVGSGKRDPLLDLSIEDGPITSDRFPVALADPLHAWATDSNQCSLTRTLTHRRQRSTNLLGNYIASVGWNEHHENWRSLYLLPPAIIDRLRANLITAKDKEWLRALPKADLHRHIGGCLDLSAQKRVALELWQQLTLESKDFAHNYTMALNTQATWPWDWPEKLKSLPVEQRAACSAALLLHCDHEVLEYNLYGVTRPRLALKFQHNRGFSAYERPGDLSGSALLGHPLAIAPYAREIVAQARSENLRYLELRGSPDKYAPAQPLEFIRTLEHALNDAGANRDMTSPTISFIWILDRRRQDTWQKNIKQAVQARRTSQEFMIGLDLAGDERTYFEKSTAEDFTPAFRDCLHITIHAGEGEEAENIWRAAYQLHAERIGHGLTLRDHKALLQRFRDRDICLELCPTSNYEVVGFRHPDRPESLDEPQYPLREFIQSGVPVTICTDNPGISRTNMADEFIAASAMTTHGLSQWEVLSLIKQGFAHSFVSSHTRNHLLKTVDTELFSLLTAQD